jgi:rhodanese-related sulfurtransferase
VSEVNLLKFVTEHIFLVALAAVSGGMLIWPALRRGAGGPSISSLQATLLINQQNALVLDVRDAAEYEKGHVLNARHIAMGELQGRSAEIERYKAKPVIVVCESGNRSEKAAATLRKQGFGQVFSLNGGMGAWKQAGLPLEK